ncbi:hypothetical protein [Massilia sp. PWRC2]|uniref:hypothetical protein n=1 Tax=Massilia sp. PWRC2 TaxID=2804626 RepID=UPI003CE82B7B
MNSKFPGPCDVKKWGRTELWDIFEAAHVLVDIEPSTDPDPYFELKADELYKQLAMSIAMGYPQIAQQIGERHLFLPLQMVDWALKKGHPVSGALQAEIYRTARENIDRLTAEKALRAALPSPSAHNGEPTTADVDKLSDDQWADPAYMSSYKRAWKLYDELAEWSVMKHGGDPFRAIAIKKRINSINDELARLNCPSANASTQADLQPLRPAPLPLTLEDALRQNEEQKKQAKKLAAEMAPEMEKRRSLQVRLDSLPQDERRRVLDAAGMGHASAVPAPIEPLHGSGSYAHTRHELPLVVPQAGEQVLASKAAPFDKNRSGDRAAAAAKRQNADVTRERGARRRIIENWDAIELEYWPKIDARIVLRVLARDKGEDQPELKTVQNHLSSLRTEGLIP